MFRAVSALAVLAAAASIASCGRLVMLAADPWWSAAAAGSPATARRIGLAALRHGYVPSIVAVPVRESARERLVAALSHGRVAVAVLGPPLCFRAGEIAIRFPDVTFVLVGGPDADDGIPNTVQLVYDRAAAFHEAGSIAAAAGTVAVLAAPGRPEAETKAFVKGVLSVAGAVVPASRTLANAPTLDSLKSAVSEMRGAGVEVFLYRPTGSGAAFLDVLAAAGGRAVVEDWAASRPRPGQVLASIEEDLAAGIGACLARGAPSVVTVAATLVRRDAAGEPAGRKAGSP